MLTLNEEYVAQLINYQKEKDEREKEYTEKISKIRKENECAKQIDYTPEMIPPDQTFKIFLHFIKHLQYEDVMYRKYITKNDIKSVKQFLSKVENYNANEKVNIVLTYRDL
jgi:hypothetical protein